MSLFSVSFIVFSMFFMLSIKPQCSIVLLPFSLAILTNLILFVFHVPNTTHYCSVLLFFNLFVISLYLVCLFNLIWVQCAWWNTHTMVVLVVMVVLHNGLYNFTVFYILHRCLKKKEKWPSFMKWPNVIASTHFLSVEVTSKMANLPWQPCTYLVPTAVSFNWGSASGYQGFAETDRSSSCLEGN